MGGSQWAYQKVGRDDKAYLLKQSITVAELQTLSEVSEQSFVAPAPLVEAVPTEAQAVPPEPTAPVPEKKKRGLSRWVILGGLAVGVCFVCAVAALLVGIPSSDQATATPMAVAGTTEAPADTPVPLNTPVPTSSPQPSDTPLPTATPKPTEALPPAEPVIFLNITGTEDTVSENFEASECFKAVFPWSVESKDSGFTSLVVNLYNAQTEKGSEIISEMEMDVAGIMRGEALKVLVGGTYYVTTENSSGPWTLQGICREGEAPSGEGIDLSGEGQIVSGNFILEECQKSVFVWSVEPSSSGFAQLGVGFVDAQAHQGGYLVNEMEMDVTGALSGETLEPVSGGVYFVYVESASGPWTLRWECRD
jgi:hypothetical protein